MALARAGAPAVNKAKTVVTNADAYSGDDASAYSVEQIAQVCHAATRALQEISGEPASPVWGRMPTEQRASVMAAVALAQQGTPPDALHRAWCQHQRSQGWRWGPVRDEQAKRSPALVPYCRLPAEQRMRDTVVYAIVRAMSGG